VRKPAGSSAHDPVRAPKSRSGREKAEISPFGSLRSAGQQQARLVCNQIRRV